jgi:2-isopropylmalate synthase
MTDDLRRVSRAGTMAAPLSRASTREEFESVLARLGYELGATDVARSWDAFTVLAERKQAVTVRDLEALLDDRLRAVAEQYQLVRMAVRTSTDEPAWAHVEILERNHEAPAIAEATGDGPVDAAFCAIREALHIDAELVRFSIDALSGGTDALAEAHIVISLEGERFAGEGVAADLTEAAARAFLRALSHERRVSRASF